MCLTCLAERIWKYAIDSGWCRTSCISWGMQFQQVLMRTPKLPPDIPASQDQVMISDKEGASKGRWPCLTTGQNSGRNDPLCYSLVFSDNQCGDQGSRALATMLRGNRRLEQFHLGSVSSTRVWRVFLVLHQLQLAEISGGPRQSYVCIFFC